MGFLEEELEQEEKQREEISFGVFSPEQIIDAAFASFRERGFPFWDLPVHVCMQEINALAALPMEELLTSILGYHVADTYHPHRFHCHAAKMKSPFEAFCDDKLLRKAMRLKLEERTPIPATYFSKLDVISGTQACFNFRPGFACYLYKKFCESGDTVLDFSTGYGGRLVGFIASGTGGKYIGIDPNTKVYEGNKKLAADMCFGDKVELFCQPAEEVKLPECSCDFAFTSPPYFCKEHYSEEETQSYKRYGDYDAWLDGFLEPALRLCLSSLKHGSYMIINIAKVKVKDVVYDLPEDMKEIAEELGFKHVRTEKYVMRKRFGSGTNEVAEEPVLVFLKE